MERDYEKYCTGDFDKDWELLQFLYTSALKKIRTKIEILEDEFTKLHHYDPIEHVSSRIKTEFSMRRKMKREGHSFDIPSLYRYMNDIAGARIVCSFTSDIYKIADMLLSEDDIRIIAIKDYIASPKANGYKSYHMIVATPVYLSTGRVETKVENQIRTIAMDFWAALEHKIFYKFDGKAPAHLKEELRECALMINAVDDRMLLLNNEIVNLKGNEEGEM